MKQVLNWDEKTNPRVGTVSETRVWTPEIFFYQWKGCEIPQPILEWSRRESAPLTTRQIHRVFSNGSFFKTWSQTTAQGPREKAGYFHFSVSKTSGFCNVLRVGVVSDREVVRGKTADSGFSFHVVPATDPPRGCDSGSETAVRQGET